MGKEDGTPTDDASKSLTIEANRDRTLDGVRGCLALIVFVHHVLQAAGSMLLFKPAVGAVWLFFIISGCVLTRAWQGRYFHFLARRFVRLWPVYALCLGAGYAFLRLEPSSLQLLWLAGAVSTPRADPPAWSLVVEAWAMLAMPLFVQVGRSSWYWLVAALLATYIAAVFIDPLAIYGAFFFIGAWMSRFQLRTTLMETALPRWLGKISYPLYLCHYPLLFDLGLPLPLSIPLAFGVAIILTETIEKWSIVASRRVFRGRRAAVGSPSRDGRNGAAGQD